VTPPIHVKNFRVNGEEKKIKGRSGLPFHEERRKSNGFTGEKKTCYPKERGKNGPQARRGEVMRRGRWVSPDRA